MDDQLTALAAMLAPVTDPAALDAIWIEAAADAEAMVRETGYVGLRAARLLHRGWPLEAVDWTLDTYHADTANRKAALSLARTLAADADTFAAATGRAGLGFSGRAGRGKTGLACAIGAAMDARGVDVAFTRWGTLADDAFAALGARRGQATPGPSAFGSARDAGQAGDSLSTITARLASVEVLIIDDLGEEGAAHQPEFLRRVFREVLWPRYERRAPTIVTTNLPTGELEAQFGEAAVSRLAGMLRWCVIDGVDERRRAA